MKQVTERLWNGIVRENPTFVLMLGMCPTLAVTTSAMGALGMGISTMVVLSLSNVMISLLRKVIPDRVHIPAYTVVVASFVTLLELLTQAYLPELYERLGVYLSLIVVNCLILERAESYAAGHSAYLSFFDGLGMGIGFTLSLTFIGVLRELFGSGTIFEYRVMPAEYEGISILVLAPGAFFVMAVLGALHNRFRRCGRIRVADRNPIDGGRGCDGNCSCCHPQMIGETTEKREQEWTENG